MLMNKQAEWDLIIKPKNKWHQIDIASLLKYKDLLFLLVKRDFVSAYKQTILGPIWFLVQPILTTITFTIIFGNLAKISTDGVPPVLFYMSGITLWTYFAECLNKTSTTFIANASIFGKVYFPRLIMPLSVLVSSMLKLGVQFLLFILVWLYFLNTNNSFSPNWQYFWLLPILVLLMAFLGLGFGLLISSLTTKYRDLTFLIGFGIQLLMYASPIVYPLSIVSDDLKFYLLLNPITPIIECFKFVFLGNAYFNWYYLLYSLTFSLILLFVSIVVFYKVEKSFMDTV